MAYPAETTRRTLRILDGVTLLAGIWVFISPFLLGLTTLDGPMLNFMIIGGAVALFALILMVRPERFEPLGWTNAILGTWLIIAPFAAGYMALAAATLTSVILGFVIMLCAGASVVIMRRAEPSLRGFDESL
ncbi:MAG: SPW repeat protein [Bradymonadaceae bacterium]